MAEEVFGFTWPDPRHYKLLPLYRAIILVLDESAPCTEIEPHQHILLDEQIQRQTVLMILTGEKTGLSAPINFESVRSQSLPLQGVDIADQVDAIRVSLKTAIRFIADLQQREEEAFPELKPSATDLSIGPNTDDISYGLVSADEWVDEIMHKAEKKGANNVYEINCVVRKMKTEHEGNRCSTPELTNFSPSWI